MAVVFGGRGDSPQAPARTGPDIAFDWTKDQVPPMAGMYSGVEAMGTYGTPPVDLAAQLPPGVGPINLPAPYPTGWVQPGVKPEPINLSSLRNMTDDQIRYLQQHLVLSGDLSGEYNDGKMDDKTIQAVTDAMAEANANHVTLWDWLAVSKAEYEAKYGDGTGGGSGPTTSTSTRISLSSPSVARAYLTQALAKELGREPSGKEVQTFLRSLNAAERANPSTTVTTSDGSGNSTSTSTDTNLDPATMAERFAVRNNPKEAHRYQTGQYYDVIASMLGM